MDYIAHFEQNVTIILLGAGESTRFCSSNLPKKQWLRVDTKPLWQIVVEKFISFGFSQIVLTASAIEAKYMQEIYGGCHIVEGGETRTQSILNALKWVKTPLVLISDIARWNIQKDVIIEIFKTYADSKNLACVAPALKVTDTMIFQTSLEQKVLPREHCLAIQTPQLSKTQILQKALERGEFSDESTAMLDIGEKVKYIQGSPLLHKLTFLDDLSTLSDLKAPSLQCFVGNGLDIHAFEEGKIMKLCGVEIDSPFGFKAHSDGDVGLHSLIDAILGAMGAGDIGEWFPDTSKEYKNADSVFLIECVLEFSRKIGYVIHNIDLSILAQAPKISPYKKQIREKLAEIFSLPLSQINIKATTGEELGFVGRKEGVCVISSVSMGFFDWSKYLSGREYR